MAEQNQGKARALAIVTSPGRETDKNRPFMIDEMRRSIPEDATLWVIKGIHSVQLKIRRSTLEKE
jgi:hypothetical protein